MATPENWRALLERCAWAEVGVVSGGVGFLSLSSREPGQAMGVADCDQGEDKSVSLLYLQKTLEPQLMEVAPRNLEPGVPEAQPREMSRD